MTRFFETRIEALKLWTCSTGRLNEDSLAEFASDDISGSPECKWQNSSKNGHVNLFCSLGEWACNVTDLLKDNRFDRFYFEKEEEATVLYRHYTRILLVMSEMLTDLQDIYLHAENLKNNKVNQNSAREFLCPIMKGYQITSIMNYINKVCKHKTQNIHICNDHAPIHFEDGEGRRNSFKYFSIEDSIATQDKNAILVPKLKLLIGALVVSYGSLDEYFSSNTQKFDTLCAKFL